MKRITVFAAVLLVVLTTAGAALAQSSMARVRIVHASPDAPPMDILVDGGVAFSSVPFKTISDYADLAPGTYNIKVVPSGETEPVVIEADLDLVGGQDYTIVALGTLDDIEPIVLSDENVLPAAKMSKIRFVHASPDAPNVDIKIKDGPVLLENVAFKEASPDITVVAGTYDLEVVVRESGAVALDLPGLTVSGETVYTVFAMGLADGEPALQVVYSVDAGPVSLQAVPIVGAAPVELPKTGGLSETWLYALAALWLGTVLVGSGLWMRRKSVKA